MTRKPSWTAAYALAAALAVCAAQAPPAPAGDCKCCTKKCDGAAPCGRSKDCSCGSKCGAAAKSCACLPNDDYSCGMRGSFTCTASGCCNRCCTAKAGTCCKATGGKAGTACLQHPPLFYSKVVSAEGCACGKASGCDCKSGKCACGKKGSCACKCCAKGQAVTAGGCCGKCACAAPGKKGKKGKKASRVVTVFVPVPGLTLEVSEPYPEGYPYVVEPVASLPPTYSAPAPVGQYVVPPPPPVYAAPPTLPPAPPVYSGPQPVPPPAPAPQVVAVAPVLPPVGEAVPAPAPAAASAISACTSPCVVPAPRVIPPAPAVLTSREAVPAKTASGEAEKAYVLELKLVELRPDGKVKELIRFPKVTFLESQPATVQVGTTVALKEGSISDLVSPDRAVGAEDQVTTGKQMRVRVTGLEKGRAKVDLTVERAEVESASKSGIVVLGNSLRVVRQVRLGKPVKIALDKDDQGSARTRVEFTVTRDRD